jgi:hypothetical protein
MRRFDDAENEQRLSGTVSSSARHRVIRCGLRRTKLGSCWTAIGIGLV